MRYATAREICRTLHLGLWALDLVPRHSELALTMIHRNLMGQHFFAWDDDLRLTSGAATPQDVALGGLLHLAGVPIAPNVNSGKPDVILMDLPKTPLSAHERLTASIPVLPWLTTLGWRQGMALAELAPAARALCPNAAWIRPQPDSFYG